ncbi:MAG: 2-amino-4-hydroxy-6-hydroxymethyldihydropteridine diphosphokinase [Selenomonadaceae bacterium]|nr:2-amino-4-hydroxy-6-hydroxymethyldihydropteridine diphosphokinase [Selenomonadaceae bacterium]
MIAYLGLGANLGDRVKNLRRAIECVKKISDVELLRVSSFYETAAWGVTNQPDFINAAIKISTTLEPLKLLDVLQKIETDMEITRHEHWAARLIDIDILLIEDMKINSERLIIPHKFLYERDFVKVPLAEISPLKLNLRGERVKKNSDSPIDFNLKLIACVDKNFGLGYKGELLFRIDEDLKNFRRLTINQTVIYGRRTLKTFPSGKPLDLRRNIIFSRSKNKIDGAEIVHSVEELWEELGKREEGRGKKNSSPSNLSLIPNPYSLNFVIGGAEIFHELLPYVTEIYLTVVDNEKISDVTFPNFNEEFILENREQGTGNNKIEFRHYVRRNYAE